MDTSFSHAPIKILLVEDNPGDARLLKEYLVEPEGVEFEMTHVERLNAALEKLTKVHFDIVLLDLILPDSRGLETFLKIHSHNEAVPIVVLSGIYDESLAVKAVHEGAQDYLVKGQVNSSMLIRALRYAIERNSMQMALRSQSLIDDLTGLYNRRGFQALAQQQLKLSRRTKRGFFLVFVDLDGLKKINDGFGHLEGDKALIAASKILKKTFRETDLLARIGGDEFTVLAIDASGDDAQAIVSRLEKWVKEYNSLAQNRYVLSLSCGIVYCDSRNTLSLEQLIKKADEELYKIKKLKKQG